MALNKERLCPFVFMGLWVDFFCEWESRGFVEARGRFLRLRTICLRQGGGVRRMVFLWRVWSVLAGGGGDLRQVGGRGEGGGRPAAPKPKPKSAGGAGRGRGAA